MKFVMELCVLRRFSAYLPILLTCAFFSGCAVTEFLGAYFNTYYNAQKLFAEAETEVLHPATRALNTRPDTRFLPPFDISPQTKTKFTSVIEKCSKLLQYHPDSKLVDDALLMIGKSYYYQNENESAERKFKELLGTYPQSGLALETRLLLANTYYRSNQKTAAATEARNLVEDAQKEGEEGIVAEAALLLAHVDLENKEYQSAAEHYRMAAENAGTAEQRSGAYQSLAGICEQQADYKKALEAYADAEDAAGDYVGVYRGKIGQARVLSHIGKYEQSLSILEDLIKNTNYKEFFGEIDLEIANVFQAQQDYASAEAQYRYVDTTYARTEVAANSYYQSGLMYETKLFQFDSARVAYNKGRNEFPPGEITQTLQKKSDILNKYFTYYDDIVKYDSIRSFILSPPDTAGRTMAQQDTTHRDSALGLATRDSTALKAPSVPPPPLDTVMNRLALNKSEMAGLFYSGFENIDSAKYWYERVLQDHPRSAYAPRAIYTLVQIRLADSSISRPDADSMYKTIVDEFPRSEFAAEARRQLGMPPLVREVNPADSTYHKAEALLKEGDMPGALKLFKSIVRQDSTSTYSAKAQYSIGWIYQNMKGGLDSSIASYQILQRRFPASQYAAAVGPQLAEVAMERLRKAKEAENDTSKSVKATPSKIPETSATPGPTIQKTVPGRGLPPDSTAKTPALLPPQKDKVVEEEENKPEK